MIRAASKSRTNTGHWLLPAAALLGLAMATSGCVFAPAPAPARTTTTEQTTTQQPMPMGPPASTTVTTTKTQQNTP